MDEKKAEQLWRGAAGSLAAMLLTAGLLLIEAILIHEGRAGAQCIGWLPPVTVLGSSWIVGIAGPGAAGEKEIWRGLSFSLGLALQLLLLMASVRGMRPDPLRVLTISLLSGGCCLAGRFMKINKKYIRKRRHRSKYNR